MSALQKEAEPAGIGLRTATADAPMAAVFDLDRTITTYGTFTPFLLFCLRERRQLLPGAVGIAAAMIAYVRKEIDRKILKERMLAASIAGVTRSEMARYAEMFVDRLMAGGLRPGARRAIEQHRAAGHTLVMVTASFDFLAERIGRRLGFDGVVSTRSAWDQHARLLPKIDGENCYGPAKLRALEGITALTQGKTIVAYSDHHTDLPLFDWASAGVAVNPTKKLRRLAKARGIRIENWNV